jgi:hypothetical protein
VPITVVDRSLLACAVICVLILVAQGYVAGADCDTKCHHIRVFYEDQGTGGVNCFNWDQDDCQVCDTMKPTCRTSKPPAAGTCGPDVTKMLQYSPATSCVLKCDLPVGRWADADGTTGTTWRPGGNPWTCQ